VAVSVYEFVRVSSWVSIVTMNVQSEWMTQFNGTVRLFPLPNLVLFPHVVQGLHIFEPRYRQMMADTLESDLLIALVMLQPDWEATYDGKPAIESVACLGRVGNHEQLFDGRYNLRLIGVSRVRILSEVASEKLYRIANAELMPDLCELTLPQRSAARNQLRETISTRFDDNPSGRDQLLELVESDLPLGQLVDLLSHALPFPVEFKQSQLAEQRVEQRLENLVERIRVRPKPRRFPPEFSKN
jgi:uncharacterized protein